MHFQPSTKYDKSILDYAHLSDDFSSSKTEGLRVKPDMDVNIHIKASSLHFNLTSQCSGVPKKNGVTVPMLFELNCNSISMGFGCSHHSVG